MDYDQIRESNRLRQKLCRQRQTDTKRELVRNKDRERKRLARARVKEKINKSKSISEHSVRKHSQNFRRKFKNKPQLLLPVVKHILEQVSKNSEIKSQLEDTCVTLFGEGYCGDAVKSLLKINGLKRETKKKKKDKSVKAVLEIKNRIDKCIGEIRNRYSSLRRASKVCGLPWSSFHRMCSLKIAL